MQMVNVFPEYVSEACRGCPELSPAIEAWAAIDSLRDAILTSSTEITDENLALIPDEVIRRVGQVNNLSLDPAIDADRKEALNIIQRDNGATYMLLGNISTEIEKDVTQKTYVCQDKGPIKLRVKTEVGSTIVSLCRAEVKTAPTATATIQQPL